MWMIINLLLLSWVAPRIVNKSNVKLKGINGYMYCLVPFGFSPDSNDFINVWGITKSGWALKEIQSLNFTWNWWWTRSRLFVVLLHWFQNHYSIKSVNRVLKTYFELYIYWTIDTHKYMFQYHIFIIHISWFAQRFSNPLTIKQSKLSNTNLHMAVLIFWNFQYWYIFTYGKIFVIKHYRYFKVNIMSYDSHLRRKIQIFPWLKKCIIGKNDCHECMKRITRLLWWFRGLPKGRRYNNQPHK